MITDMNNRKVGQNKAAGVLALLLCLRLSATAYGAEGAGANDLLKTANERIDAIRKAPVQVRVLDSQGNPVEGAVVRVEQRRHAFLFGCNVFGLYGYRDEQHQLYAARFSALFNYATLPFYWGMYEPEKNNTIWGYYHDKDLAQWCKAYHIETKGHPLVWHGVYPKWAPSDPDATREALHQRIAAIIPEFKSDIHRWDVVNEAVWGRTFTNGLGLWLKRDGPAKVVETALQWAHEANPDAQLVYNDFDTGPEHQQLIEKLARDNAPFQIIGIQSHMHRGEWPLEKVWDICERYSKFGKAIHFSEVTVLSGKHGWELPQPWPTTPAGERWQADYVEKLYTVLFSHPAVQAITWWDLQDGAWQGAPAGLLRADLTPKPAYDRLMKLIHQTWWTRASLSSDQKGMCAFAGFLGDYEVTVQNGDVSRTVEYILVKGTNEWTITLESRKISGRPTTVSEPPNPYRAIKLDTKFLDAIAGQYEFPSNAIWPPTGMKVTIWREGDRLFGQARGKDVLQSVVEIYPQSETNFFLKVNGAQLTFI
jgi:GH35 family endo-1,4-beta-xylanase